jgi:hypothetical protein
MAGAGAVLDFVPFLKAIADLGLVEMGMEVERGVAQDIVDRAQSIVHVGGGDDPNAGETRDSIKWGNDLHDGGEGIDATGAFIDVGSMLEKAFYEEFGSVHGPAVSFLRTAIAEAMGGKGGFGVSWSQMTRPKAISKARKARNVALRAAQGR